MWMALICSANRGSLQCLWYLISEIKPNKSFVFRWSALTLSAHLIHLNNSYTQHVESYWNLPVRSPLMLVLLLMALQNHLVQLGLVIKDIELKKFGSSLC